VGVNAPALASKISAVDRGPLRSCPPVTRTLPEPRSVAVCSNRTAAIEPVEVNAPVVASKSSDDER
jgi:hypothetical protein